jgi:Flp pilus assembly protein TadG
MMLRIRRALRRRAADERGSMAVEVVLLTPVLVAFLLLVVAFGRYVAVQGDMEAAARDAAREASLQFSSGAASSAARKVVTDSLDDGTNCEQIDVGGSWQPGGEVVVRMHCTVSLSGLGLIGLPGDVGIDTESAVPLDPYRRYE